MLIKPKFPHTFYSDTAANGMANLHGEDVTKVPSANANTYDYS